ncbi:alpha-(1,3)-fucosyltransferase C-like [Ornithodoros turicata]|uniref:alpha-(1,3)-fucosyltransferase C-like n=1 Tax=Ornithodoros turicata TaxID=34597 RepID=UPI00313972B9
MRYHASSVPYVIFQVHCSATRKSNTMNAADCRIVAITSFAMTALLFFYMYSDIYAYFLRAALHSAKYTRATAFCASESCYTSDASREFPRILAWTKFYRWRVLGLGPDGEIEIPHCSRRCRVTYDRALLEVSDAVVIHSRNLDPLDLPAQRSPRQKWVFWCKEPPPLSFFGDFKQLASLFNWTMTYRSDSDVHVPYGFFTRKKGQVSINFTSAWRRKKKTAVWIVSNCNAHSKREKFVRRLRKYIDVDVYGGCGSLKCPPERKEDCFRKFENEYFFRLALENSLCREYATEKLFSTLQHNLVPVALGSVNYTDIAPPHSVIDVSSFASPRKLANYLKKVKNDFEMYKRYLVWKETYDVLNWKETFCSLCQKLYDEAFKARSVYENLWSWWVSGSRCYHWNDSTSRVNKS